MDIKDDTEKVLNSILNKAVLEFKLQELFLK